LNRTILDTSEFFEKYAIGEPAYLDLDALNAKKGDGLADLVDDSTEFDAWTKILAVSYGHFKLTR